MKVPITDIIGRERFYGKCVVQIASEIELSAVCILTNGSL